MAASDATVFQLVQVEPVQLITGAAHQVVGEAYTPAFFKELLAAFSVIHLRTEGEGRLVSWCIKPSQP